MKHLRSGTKRFRRSIKLYKHITQIPMALSLLHGDLSLNSWLIRGTLRPTEKQRLRLGKLRIIY
jgi:hypothetical protein